jgi:acetyltransferase-like isoleucine patch superfamily enzyme
MSFWDECSADWIRGSEIGPGTVIEPFAFVHDSRLGSKNIVRKFANIFRAEIGDGNSVAAYVEIGGAKLGSHNKIEAFAFVPVGVIIGNGVFVGPHVCFTNDLHPRAVAPDGSLLKSGDWQLLQTIVEDGVSIGANSTVVCGIRIGAGAMIGAGSVVTKDVEPGVLVCGNPASPRRSS